MLHDSIEVGNQAQLHQGLKELHQSLVSPHTALCDFTSLWEKVNKILDTCIEIETKKWRGFLPSSQYQALMLELHRWRLQNEGLLLSDFLAFQGARLPLEARPDSFAARSGLLRTVWEDRLDSIVQHIQKLDRLLGNSGSMANPMN